MGEPNELMTPREVARFFRVNPRTVSRWGKSGKLSTVRTPGGHSRYLRTEVERLYRESTRRRV